ncbi:hypothetical protein [Cytobacillus depressus]|nr:hypothetical protein [Cytobacillus depressus]
MKGEKTLANSDKNWVEALHNSEKEAPSNHLNMISQDEFLQIMKVNKAVAMALLEQNLVISE